MSISTYELIKKLETLEYYPQILTTGIVPMNWIDYKVIYEFYLDELKVFSKHGILTGQELRTAKRTAVTSAVDEFKIGESSVYRIIKNMEA